MQNDDQTLRCTLNSILELLTSTIPLFGFMEKVKFIMDTPATRSGDVPIQLIKITALFAAYMKQAWGDSTDGIWYAEIFNIQDFKQFLFDAQDELSRQKGEDGPKS
jgi:hypothetical protein